ncbi:hypothetical protein B0H14DRAFT_2904883 [Mycena olivaceomarginata]|nr:hypothetical protein B0H14DRAFT_2904883 [Mycena olivaceomarginata]
MSPREQVPYELWLEIFRSLPPDALEHLSLTCTEFKAISRPHLFNEFYFRPYKSGGTDGILLPPTTEVNRAMERLEFWCSDEIAPHVRSCVIAPWREGGPVWSRWDFAATSTPYVLLAAFFERLGAFTGLQNFSATDIHFTQPGVASLCRAPALASVRLEDCSIAPGEHIDTSSRSLGVARFFHHMRTSATGNGDIWFSLLRPDSLQEVDLTLDLDSSLFGDNKAIPSFPNVHTFATTSKFPTIPYIISILSKFSAVQNFSMICWGELRDVPDLRAEASSLLPVLRHYTGPSETMAFFVPRANLTHLTIQNCSPLDFIAQLQRIGGLQNITSLTASFEYLGIAMVGTICAFFPMLTALRITLSLWAEFDDDNHVSNFLIEFAETSTLVVSLEQLALTCEVDYDAGPMNVPEFDELRDALVARYPRLTALWFDARQFLFHWRKLLDGSEVKYTTEHWNDAEDMRYNGFDAFWETQR